MICFFVTRKIIMMTASSKPLSIFITAVDGTGHINAAIGLGQTAVQRGHKVSFLINETFKGQASQFGLTEIFLVDEPKSKSDDDQAENPVKKVAHEMLSSGLFSGVNSLEKLKIMKRANFFEDIFQRAIVYEPQIEQAIKEGKPDLIILDHLMISPAIQRSGVPLVLSFSSNPVMFFNSQQKLPPPCSGFATTSDPATWEEFNAEYKSTFPDVFKSIQERFNQTFNYKPTIDLMPSTFNDNDDWYFPQSPYLNLYACPLELDYQDIVPIPENYCQIDAFSRVMPQESSKQFALPSELNVQPGDKVIYLSMGSLGSIDIKLMQKFASILAKTPHKIIVSKGPRASEYELPNERGNIWGTATLPQTALLPLVDLVITHGGNNTVTETFAAGKPQIVHPLFGDQWDNAQRVEEKGFGFRLKPYIFTEKELLETVDRLLNDSALNERLKVAAKRIQTDRSKDRAFERMELIVAQQKLLSNS